MRRKTIMILLMTCMVFSLLPVGAYAVGGSPFDGGTGADAGNAYLISTEAQLRILAGLVNAGDISYNDKYYRLTSDLSLSSPWTPIGNSGNGFKGHFDGGGHIMSDLTIAGANELGLFGWTDAGSTVENIVLEDVSIIGGTNIGGVVGRAYGTVSGCTVSGTISGDNIYCGGITGASEASITDCHTDCSVSGSGRVGGITGYLFSTSAQRRSILRCSSAGTITGRITGPSDQDVGGIAGFISPWSTVSNCYVTGDVSGKTYVGGIVGQKMGWISNCYATGTISGEYTVGGLVGYAGNSAPANCVSLNASVTVTGGSVGRAVGALGSAAGADMLSFTGMAGGVFTDARGTTTKNGGDLGCLDITAEMNSRFGGNAAIAVNPWSNCDYSSLPGLSGAATRPAHLYATVVYDVNGGGTVAPLSAPVEADGKLSSLPEPVRAGYTFNGWYPVADGSGAIVTVETVFTSNTPVYAAWTPVPARRKRTPSRTITVTETRSSVFESAPAPIRAEANMTNAFSSSVEVKVTDTDESASGFGFGIGNRVYPFDISLYIKGTNMKTEPKDGYAVTISLPVPEDLLDLKEQLSVVHKGGNGRAAALASRLRQISDAWYLVFEATEFSPYALVVDSGETYDEAAGLPFYTDGDGIHRFIGFATNGKYIALPDVTVQFKENEKIFTDIDFHWAKAAVGFVSEREIFLGTGAGIFSPERSMSRGMFAAVMGRLYERSYEGMESRDPERFSDCAESMYYGKYVSWAFKEGLINGYGDGRFGPEDPITREQIASMLYRFADFLDTLPEDRGTALGYNDTDSISEYARNAVLYCQSAGIMTGRSEGFFVPEETATRAEVAMLLERFIKHILE